LILVFYLDDALCTGEKEEVEWMYKIIENELKIEKQGHLKKHIAVWYNWTKEKTGKNIFGSLHAKNGERHMSKASSGYRKESLDI
jgi:hypothetical protein